MPLYIILPKRFIKSKKAKMHCISAFQPNIYIMATDIKIFLYRSKRQYLNLTEVTNMNHMTMCLKLYGLVRVIVR